MNEQSARQRRQGFLDLGNFIVHQYNRKTGMLAYDPEGLYQDIMQQAERLCAEEIQAIRDAAEEARRQLRAEAELLQLKCELSISNAQIRAYERIFELSQHFMSALATQQQPDTTAERLRALEVNLPQDLAYKAEHEDAYTAFNIAVHNLVQDVYQKASRQVEHLGGWAKRTFRAPDLER